MTAFDKGTLIRCTAEFINTQQGTDVDPTTVTFKARSPSGALTTYATPASQLVHDGTGRYHVDLNLNESGAWTYRFESTGTFQATAESIINVNPSVF